jgi:hypothetical protein
MAHKVIVGGSTVRTWATSTEGQDFLVKWAAENQVDVPNVGGRGRFNEALLTAFHAANKGKKYQAGHDKKIKVSGMRPNSAGGKTPLTVTTTPAEIRAFAKSQGLAVNDKGRISAEVRAAFVAHKP